MRRIIKAELFRLGKTKVLLYTMLVYTAATVVFPFIFQRSMITFGFDMYKCISFISANSMAMPVTAALLSLCVSGTFNGMISSHEISCGFSVHKMILSRLAVYSVLVAAAYMIPGAVLCNYFRIKNDAGGLSGISLFINSLFVILSMVWSAVLITLLLRKRVLSAVVSALMLVPGYVCDRISHAFIAEDRDVSLFFWKLGMLFTGFQSRYLPLLSLSDSETGLNGLMYSGSAIIVCFAVVSAVLYSAVIFRYKAEKNK